MIIRIAEKRRRQEVCFTADARDTLTWINIAYSLHSKHKDHHAIVPYSIEDDRL